MAWNRPSEDGRARTPAAPRRTRSVRPTVAVIAGAIVVFGAAVAAWWLRPGGESAGETPPPQSMRQIKKVTPRIPTSGQTAAEVPSNTLARTKWTPQLKLERTKDVQPPALSQRDLLIMEASRQFFGTPVFKRSSENFIADVLSTVPGDRFLTDQVSSDFDDDFAASLKEKIEILPDDDEDVRAQKEAVIAAKKSLESSLRKGQPPSAAIRDFMQDLDGIADYRDKLKANVDLILKEGTEEDVRLYVEEANRNLEEYSARPIEVSPFQYELLRRRIEKRNSSSTQERVLSE